MMRARELRPEDYTEPLCPLRLETQVTPIDRGRFIEKLDQVLGQRDFGAAKRLLAFWLQEARAGHDQQGELMVLNETIGFWRKQGAEKEALAAAASALNLIDEMGLTDHISAATTCVNAGTALNAFGKNREALPLFERAKAIYESRPGTRVDLIAGLYNNMGLVLTGLGRHDEAMSLYHKALALMKQDPQTYPEAAVTCLNMANTLEAKEGSDQAEKAIADLVEEALSLLSHEDIPQDSDLAFVLEKCAPTVAYYGFFLDAEALKKKAEALYARA